MKQRTPVYITILIIVCLLFIVLYMFVQNTSFLASPYFWGTVIIASIIAMIQHSIGDLVENAKFKALSEEEKKLYLESKKFLTLKVCITVHSRNSRLQKKRIF